MIWDWSLIGIGITTWFETGLSLVLALPHGLRLVSHWYWHCHMVWDWSLIGIGIATWFETGLTLVLALARCVRLVSNWYWPWYTVWDWCLIGICIGIWFETGLSLENQFSLSVGVKYENDKFYVQDKNEVTRSEHKSGSNLLGLLTLKRNKKKQQQWKYQWIIEIKINELNDMIE